MRGGCEGEQNGTLRGVVKLCWHGTRICILKKGDYMGMTSLISFVIRKIWFSWDDIIVSCVFPV